MACRIILVIFFALKIRAFQNVFKITLLYFVAYCMDHSHYTCFLESEIEKFYNRIEAMEQILWKQFLYPLGDPQDIDYHPVI
jgi:hypothetical protein